MGSIRGWCAISALFSSALAAQGTADPEIFLMPLSVQGARVTVGKPANVTNRRGYDNQPSFTRDGRSLYFTSTREDAQADIYRYDIGSKAIQRITKTAPESEYSATQLPNANRFSVIRVERDSTQRLWSFTPDGTDPKLVLTGIKPVGYHAWVDANRLALFVLGSPNALVLADTRSGKGDTLARDVGRSLLTLPHGGGFSYLARHDGSWTVTVVRLKRDGSVVYVNPLVSLPKGMDYVAWIGGGLIGGTGSKLYSWTPGGEWTEIADLGSEGLTNISRIAVSPDRRTLALVAEPASAR